MNIKYLITLFAILLLFGCQKEDSQVIATSPGNLKKSSPLYGLLERATQSPTALDNIIDNCSCFKVQFPYNIIVNNQSFLMNDDSDYVTVQAAMNAFSNDDDIVHIIFPVTIQYKNFNTKSIESASELQDEVADCEEEDFPEIACVQLNYPIRLNVYDAITFQPATFTFTSDTDLYRFINELPTSTIVALQYPISVVNPNGQNVVVSSNKEFENILEDAIDDCPINTNGNLDFTTVLTSGNWKITYFFKDQNVTSLYTGYIFSFFTNGNRIEVTGTSNANGTWATYLDSGVRKLDIHIDGNALEDLNEDWRVIEYNTTTIRLKDVSGGNGDTDYLYFTKM